ncbi:MAG TPA: CAP domain-containing protein, partial [Candidatus Obscuribacterales bacterium]
EQMLAAHNAVRRTVGVSDLAWSAELATLAQDWAEVLLQSGQMRHRPASERDQGRIGENITSSQASGAGGALRHPQRAVKGWVDERADYDYATNPCTPGQVCGHYTQMVWADTDAVGCGVARNADQTREVWVCNYSPAGNFVGERPY